MEPQMNADERRLNELTEKIIGCAYEVSNRLGCGFLESIYHKAMLVELTHAGLDARPQCPLVVRYRDVVVGEYFADLLVAGEVLVELKTVKSLEEVHTAQCINYLKATGLRICLLINFAKPKLEINRLVNKF